MTPKPTLRPARLKPSARNLKAKAVPTLDLVLKQEGSEKPPIAR